MKAAYRVQRAGYREQGTESRGTDAACRTQNTGRRTAATRVQRAGYREQGIGCSVQGAEHRTQNSSDQGAACRVQNTGGRTQGGRKTPYRIGTRRYPRFRGGRILVADCMARGACCRLWVNLAGESCFCAWCVPKWDGGGYFGLRHIEIRVEIRRKEAFATCYGVNLAGESCFCAWVSRNGTVRSTSG